MKSFFAFVALAQKVLAFIESAEGQKLIADLKVLGAELLAEIKAVELDVQAVEKAVESK